jgi:hypothetical protein
MNTETMPAQGPVDVDVSPLPCPFCGDQPWFEGDANQWRDDRRYVELSLTCCATMTENIAWRNARDMTAKEKESELKRQLITNWNNRHNA